MWKRASNPVDIAIGLLVIGLAVVMFRDSPHVYSFGEKPLDLSLRYLPFYALASVARMIAAMVVSLIVALMAGYLAAVNRRWSQVILPAADILQSVPLVAFFPAAVALFIRIFGSNAVGVEMAAIFLIITSALWNLIFAVYESISTIPEDLQFASRQFRLHGYIQWTRVILPAVIPKLAYNSMISWANGWYFLIASEIIVMGPIKIRLPGLGSYLAQTMYAEDYGHAIYGLLALTFIIAVFHLFVWGPLNGWSVRFMHDTAETAMIHVRSRSRLRFYMARSELLYALWNRGVRPVILSIASVLSFILERERTRRGNAAAWSVLVAFVGAIAWGVRNSAQELLQPTPLLHQVPGALILSFVRLLAAYVLALAWTLPLALWIGRSERIAQRVMPIVEVIASIPATAFFPLIALFILRWGGDMNLASIILVTTGMQWYLLFNLIAGVRAIPEDLHQISESLGLKAWARLKRLTLPAIYPSLVTGSLSAIGGGWNALILSEWLQIRGRVYAVLGIGAVLDRATYESFNLQLIVASIGAMVLFILIVNRFVWQPAYELAKRKFALNY